MPYDTLDPGEYYDQMIRMGASEQDAKAAANELKERQR